MTGFALKPINATDQNCIACPVAILNCITCSSPTVCLTCDVGWVISSGSCQCDTVANNLLYCQTCTNPTTCTACVSNQYFLKTADTKCYPCSNFDVNCVECSAENVCTLCATTYGIETFTNATTLCVPCSTTITNCQNCLVSTACTLCSTTYYATSAGIC